MGRACPGHTQGGVHQHSVVQVSRSCGNIDGLHLSKAAQRVALVSELCYLPLAESTGDEKNDVVDHVAVPMEEKGHH